MRTPRGALLAVLLALACQSAAPPAPPRAAAPASPHGYALLFELLGQEQDVDKLLLVKRERADLGELMGSIAETCGAAHERLAALGEADPALNLTDPGLPGAELAVREAIEGEKTKLLLTESGKEFELQLVLSQLQALSYALHLSEVLARAEPDAERLAFVRQLYRDLGELRERTTALLRSRYAWPAADPK
jgi:hypothetical protein